MSEQAPPYAGHDGPLVDWPCQAYAQLVEMQREHSQVWALALAEMPMLHKEILSGVAWILTLPPNPGIPAGWVAARSIAKMHYAPVAAALAMLVTRGLLEQYTNCYRLTPLGQDAARRLGEG